MKKFAADNLMFLRQSYPEIYKMIRNRQYDSSTIRITDARNGMANLSIVNGDSERAFYSKYDPETEARKWHENLADQIRGKGHLIVYGFGLGYHIEVLLEENPEVKIYIYEPETNYFLAAVEARDLRSILRHPNIAMFAVGDDNIVRTEMLREIFRSITDSFELVVPAPYQRLNSEGVKQFSELIVRTSIDYRSALATVSYFQKQWAENIVINTALNLRTPPFIGIEDSCKGIPAIVVGAGPSLSADIEWVKKLKNKTIIIASGSSIQSLLSQGIEPHLIVSMDPGEANRRVFSNLNIREIPFLYISTIKHTAIDQDAKYLTHAFYSVDHISYYLMGLSEDDAIFTSSSTVTGTAVQVAQRLGCSEIVFIGQDFSFPNNQLYADGVQHVRQETLSNRLNEASIQVENVAGGWNITNQDMLTLKEGLENILDQLPYDKYYNASRIGAKIRYTNPKTLNQLYEETKHYDFKDTWFKELFQKLLKKYSDTRIQTIHSRIRKTHEQLHLIIDQFNQMHQLINEDTQEGASNQNERKIESVLGSITKLMESPVYRHIYGFLLQREMNYLDRYFPVLNQEKDTDVKWLLLKKYISPLLEGEKRVSPVLKRSFNVLLKRLDQ